jgi:nitrite reductase/ring-hydroxylating ferredoxin subunit
MALLKVCAFTDLKPGTVTEVVSGGRPFAVLNCSGEIICFDGTCPHAGGPLGQGVVEGEMLVCPWHGWQYRCRTGVNDSDEDLILEQFPVLVSNGDIFIEVPE